MAVDLHYLMVSLSVRQPFSDFTSRVFPCRDATPHRLDLTYSLSTTSACRMELAREALKRRYATFLALRRRRHHAALTANFIISGRAAIVFWEGK